MGCFMETGISIVRFNKKTNDNCILFELFNKIAIQHLKFYIKFSNRNRKGS
jgi:hypothetical protein